MDNLSDDDLRNWVTSTDASGRGVVAPASDSELSAAFETEVDKLNKSIKENLEKAEVEGFAKDVVLDAIKVNEMMKEDPVKALGDVAKNIEDMMKLEGARGKEARDREMEAVKTLVRLREEEKNAVAEQKAVEKSFQNIVKHFSDGGGSDYELLTASLEERLSHPATPHETLQKYKTLQEKLTSLTPTDTTQLRSLLTQCIALDGEHNHATQITKQSPVVPLESVKNTVLASISTAPNEAARRKYLELLALAEATDPMDGDSTADLMTQCIAVEMEAATIPTIPTTTPEHCQLSTAEVDVGKENFFEFYMLQGFIDGCIELATTVTINFVEGTHPPTVRWGGGQGGCHHHAARGLFTVCKTLVRTVEGAGYLYPVRSIEFFAKVDEVMEAVRPVVSITKAICEYQYCPGTWGVSSTAANEDFSALLTGLHEALSRVNSEYYLTPSGVTLVSANSPLLPDYLLMSCVTLLARFGMRPRALACHKIDYAMNGFPVEKIDSPNIPDPDPEVMKLVSKWLETKMMSKKRAKLAGLS